MLACWSLLASDTARAQAPAAPAANAVGSVPTKMLGPSSVDLPSLRRRGERYRLSIGACEGSAVFKVCQFGAQLVRERKAEAPVALDPVWSEHLSMLDPSAVPGLGDPLGKPSRWKAWKVGSGENAQTMGATVVRLGDNTEGVVLRRIHGGAARDALLVPSSDQTLRVLPMPGRWSALEAQSGAAPSGQVIQFAQWPGDPGFVWARSSVFDERAGTLEPARAEAAAHVVALGPYPTAGDAAAASKTSCLPGGVTSPTDPYQGIVPGGYMLAAISADLPLAKAALASAMACARAPHGSVFPLRFRWQPKASYQLHAGAHVEVGLGSYDGTGWPFRLALSESGKASDPLDLAWSVSTPVMASAQDQELPAGDPLHPWRAQAPELSGWSLGDPSAPAVVAVRPLRLAKERTGLLVSMEAGSEHRKRWHGIIVADAGHLRAAWSATDPEGPAWSTVVVRPQPDGTEGGLYLSVFEASEAGRADTLSVSHLVSSSDARSVSVADLACDGSISLAVVRAFPGLKSALAAKGEPCASPDRVPTISGQRPLLLPAPRGSGLRGYVLAYVSTDKAEARRAATESAKCWPKAHPKVISWCGSQK